MFEIEILKMAQAMASHAAVRQNVVSENIANADTPNYAAKDIASFSDIYADSDGFALRGTRAGHLGADRAFSAEIAERREPGVQSPNGNSVALETEMVKAVEVRRQHDLALTIYGTSLGLLRTSLGRR